MTPVAALLVIVGWHGATAYRVEIVGMTPKRFRIRVLQPTRLPRRGRTLAVGEEALVPKGAVQVQPRGLDEWREEAKWVVGRGT